MRHRATREPLNYAESEGERKFSPMWENGRQREPPSNGYDSSPAYFTHILKESTSDSKSDPAKCALLGEQRITLCLSQHANLKLGSCWHFGFQLPEDRKESSVIVNVDKHCDITDYQTCLDFLGGENSTHRPVAIEVLVFRLDASSFDFLTALADLEWTLEVLQEHLTTVKYVVIALEEYAFCCFSLKDVIVNEIGVPNAMDCLVAITHILADIRAFWKTNNRFSAKSLLHHYFLTDEKPPSDIYLSKFVVSINHAQGGELFATESPTLKSSKLMWVCDFETRDDFTSVNLKKTPLGHPSYLDLSQIDELYGNVNPLDPACSFIIPPVTDDDGHWFGVLMPRPSEFLSYHSIHSALFKLTLNVPGITLHLTDLNNGDFKYLTHLSVIGGNITGHLDSHRVPFLKKLRIELGGFDDSLNTSVSPLVHEQVQLLIDKKLSWQLVASQDPGGWSLASYEGTIETPQEDMKSDSPPHILDLLLIMGCQTHADEWQSRLSGNPFLEEDEENHNDGVLAWAPGCVEKITAFSTWMFRDVRLHFNEVIAGQTRILNSLTCRGITLALDGAALPQLQSLNMTHSSGEISGAFPRLRTLSLNWVRMKKAWRLDARLLQSFSSTGAYLSQDVSLNPHSHPDLSALRIGVSVNVHHSSSDPVNINDDVAQSRIKHVVFDRGVVLGSFFERYCVNHVAHLALPVDVFELPKCWLNTEWRCETLIIDAYSLPSIFVKRKEKPDRVVLPLLPFVKTLTVTEDNCTVFLDREMPELTECTVPSPRMLGPKLKCPKLRCIRFTDKLLDIEKEMCLDRATYEAIGARPSEICFAVTNEVCLLQWGAFQNENEMPSVDAPLEEDDYCFVFGE